MCVCVSLGPSGPTGVCLCVLGTVVVLTIPEPERGLKKSIRLIYISNKSRASKISSDCVPFQVDGSINRLCSSTFCFNRNIHNGSEYNMCEKKLKYSRIHDPSPVCRVYLNTRPANLPSQFPTARNNTGLFSQNVERPPPPPHEATGGGGVALMTHK